jgi:hypothetical protein
VLLIAFIALLVWTVASVPIGLLLARALRPPERLRETREPASELRSESVPARASEQLLGPTASRSAVAG